MGCDIHSYAEVKRDGKWEQAGEVFPADDYDRERGVTHTRHPFNWRSYGLFGFLANVRNYSHVPCIQEPTYSLPDDFSGPIDEADGCHSHSYLSLRQLAEYDYEQTFWDRRVTKQVGPNLWSGAALAEEGEGEHITFREFLGQRFFTDLEVLKTLGAPDNVRIVFWFDS